MILVLTEPGDAAALWLARRLAIRHPVKVATPAQLVCSRRIVHRLSRDGDDFVFHLADGERLARDTVTGIVNRVLAVPDAHLQAAAPRDRDYAQAELWALLLGWLASLEAQALNPADPSGLAGAWWPPAEATYLAAHAGLPVTPGAEYSDVDAASAVASVFVLDGRIIGRPLPTTTRDAVLRFAALWGGRLLQIDFDDSPGTGAFRRATTFVDFIRGGHLLADRIARALTS